MSKEIEHSKITTRKIGKGVAEATCEICQPIKSTVNMSGSTEDIAKLKLELFLEGKPYRYLK